MKTFKALLTAAVSKHPGSRTERKLILFKNRRGYLHGIRYLKSMGIQPLKQLKALNAISCHLKKGRQHQALSCHPSVKKIERDAMVRRHLAVRPRTSAAAPRVDQAVIPWGIERIRAVPMWKYAKGSGIRAAVVDTGISRHPDLRVAGRYNAVQGSSSYDQNGHGTHVAGTLAAIGIPRGVVGAAPAVRLYGVKVLGKNGSGYISDVIEGLLWCKNHRIRVVNMSFGAPSKNAALHKAIRSLSRKGVLMIASCGNSGAASGQIDYPARYPEVIAVAASTRNNGIADFSSRGKGIDLSAPGVDIRSTYPGGGYRALSGTSMASHHVRGAAALLLSLRPKLSQKQVKSRLRRTAVRLSGAPVRAQGAGLVDALTASKPVE